MARHTRVRTDIVCMDTGEKLQHVTSIDVDAGVVWRATQPVRLNLKSPSEIETYPTRFRSVYPIHAGSFKPYLVHCYGRLDGKDTDAQAGAVGADGLPLAWI